MNELQEYFRQIWKKKPNYTKSDIIVGGDYKCHIKKEIK
jgi:hypothetical protein